VESQRARFDLAAQKLNLDEALWRVLRYPNRRNSRSTFRCRWMTAISKSSTGFRVQHSIARGPGQGRHPLTSRRYSRPSARPGQLDDLEVRRREHSFRRSQGRRDLRSAQNVDGRVERMTRRYTSELIEFIGPKKCSRPRRQHQRTNHGLDDGHLLHAHAPDGDSVRNR